MASEQNLPRLIHANSNKPPLPWLILAASVRPWSQIRGTNWHRFQFARCLKPSPQTAKCKLLHRGAPPLSMRFPFGTKLFVDKIDSKKNWVYFMELLKQNYNECKLVLLIYFDMTDRFFAYIQFDCSLSHYITISKHFLYNLKTDEKHIQDRSSIIQLEYFHIFQLRENFNLK